MIFSQDEMIQYMKEIEFDEIENCMKLYENHEYKSAYIFLKQYRNQILNELHVYQKRLDKLDFLLYQMKKSEDK